MGKRRLAITFILGIACLFFPSIACAENMDSVSVLLNGEQIVFDEAKPSIVFDRLLVPIRGVFEKAGAKVDWHDSDQSVKITLGNRALTFTLDSMQVEIKNLSSKKVSYTRLDVPAVILKGRVMIPLRAASECLKGTITWDDETKTADIAVDPGAKEAVSMSIGGRAIEMEMTKNQIGNILGNPDRVAVTPRNGNTFYTYNKDYNNYILIGFQDDKVGYVSSNAKNFMCEGFKTDMPVAKTPEKEDYLLYFESTPEKTIEYMSVYKYGVMPDVSVNETELQIFDLTNAMRVRYGLSPLKWNDALASVARAHSADMAERRYFAHENLEGLSHKDRAKRAGIDYEAYGENIVATKEIAYNNAFIAYILWVHSPSHRVNLRGGFEEVGVGIEGSSATQNFCTFAKNN